MDIARSMFENMSLLEAVSRGYVPDVASFNLAHKLANDLDEKGNKLPPNQQKTFRATMIPMRDKETVVASGKWAATTSYFAVKSANPLAGNMGANLTLVPKDEIDFIYDFGYIFTVHSMTGAPVEIESYLDDLSNFIELSGANIRITEHASGVDLLNQPLRTLTQIIRYSGFMAVTGAGPTSSPATLAQTVKPDPNQVGGISPMLLVEGRQLDCVITMNDLATSVTNVIDIEVVLATKQFKVIA